MKRLLKRIEELTGNGAIPTVEEPQLTSLITSVEQLESKACTLTELDTKVAEAITDADELEGEIHVSRAVEIQDLISEHTSIAKWIINHSETPQAQQPIAPLLNANAVPYQPAQFLPSTVEVPSVPNNETLQGGDTTHLTEPSNTGPGPVSVTPQLTTHLPKLTFH